MKGKWLSLIVLFCAISLSALIPPEYASMPLEQHPDLVSGVLENGLKYYIMYNPKPEKLIELRLLVDAGSINEDDDQLGLAHFTEHMCFNGTKNFPRSEMVEYLSSIGMGFHNGLNGGTGYDWTSYMFKLPTDDEAKMRKGISILSDIAWQVNFDPAEIERERGVIMEEWRLGQSAQQRVSDQVDLVRMAGSRYAVRNPIGTQENLKTFQHDSLIRYYRDWYRPDLQTVVIVGDYDPQKLELLIKEFFGVIPKRDNPRPKQSYPVPDHSEPRAVTVTDKEMPYSMVEATWKMDNIPVVDLGSYYNELKHDLFFTMFNARMSEISNQPNAPFAYAWGYNQSWLKGFGSSRFGSIAVEGRSEDCLQILLTELVRIRQHGFKAGEFERAKLSLIRDAETEVAQSSTQESRTLVNRILYGSLTGGNAILSPEMKENLIKGMLPEIDISEVNEIVDDMIKPQNLTISITGTEKEGLQYPDKNRILQIHAEVAASQVADYEDKTVDEPLIDKLPSPGKIVREETIQRSGIKKWVLSNGVSVYSKKTEFNADEVVLEATSPGGKAALNKRDYKAAEVVSSYMMTSGFGSFDAPSLQKATVGKLAYVYPRIETFREGWSGECSPRDMELMFQMIYLYSLRPRFNSDALSASLTQMRAFVQNSLLDPSNAFDDTLDHIVYNHHPLKTGLRPEDLDGVSLEQVERIFRDRFGDYDDFSFCIVGNFDEAQLRQYCEVYLANLPTLKRKDKIRDPKVKSFTGKKEVRFNKGSERGFVSNVSLGKAEFSAAELLGVNALSIVANEKLRENVRENMSGTYGVSFWTTLTPYPKPNFRANTWLGCDPQRAEELNKAVFATLDSIRLGNFEDKFVQNAKTTQQKRYEESLTKNSYWASSMSSNLGNGLSIDSLMDFPAIQQSIDKAGIVRMANKYATFDKNRLSVYMFPKE